MGVRRSFVNWKPYTAADKLESRKLYMVCEAECGIGTLRFAKYYEKGDVVYVSLRDDFDIPRRVEAPAEKRLFEAIFGKRRAYVIPESGFYIRTSDYGIDEDWENGAFAGCSEQLVMVGNLDPEESGNACPCFWAELPIEPEGVKYGRSVYGRNYGGGESDGVKELAAELRADFDADRVLSSAFGFMYGKSADVGDGESERPFGACVYRVPKWTVAARLRDIWEFANAAAGIPAEELSGLAEEYVNSDPEAARRLLDRMLKEYDIPQRGKRYLPLLLARVADAVPSFYRCRDIVIGRGGPEALDIPAVMQEAQGMNMTAWWVARLVRLVRMQAPEAILMHELRTCAEYETMWRDSDKIVRVMDGWFQDSYGINPDGTRTNRHCQCGDLELVWMPPEDQEPEENDEGDGEENGEAPDGSPDESTEDAEDGEKSYGPRFQASSMPNFMMRVRGYTIFDYEEHVYLRDEDGNIAVFDSYPKEELARLNGVDCQCGRCGCAGEERDERSA